MPVIRLNKMVKLVKIEEPKQGSEGDFGLISISKFSFSLLGAEGTL